MGDPSGRRLLLIEPDKDTAAFMRHMLTRAGYEVAHSSTGKEGLIIAWRDQPDAIVLELSLPDIDGLDVVRKLRKDTRTSRKRILTLTDRSGAQETERALEAGVDQYIVKQSDAVDILLRTLAEVFEEGGPEGDTRRPSRPGRILSFISAKGGVGTSSLCLNVAQTLAERNEELRAAVMDLVLPLGYLAQITGSQLPIDIVHLTTQLKPDELTPEYLRTNLTTPKSWAIPIVPGARDPEQGAKLHADRLAPVLQTMRTAFDRVIVDLGRTLSPLALLVLRQSDVVVMVFSTTPATVHATNAVLRYLQAQGIDPERFFLLSNRPLGTEDMSSEEVASSLTRPLDASVPNVGANMTLTNRLNAPLSLRFPEDPGTERIMQIALLIEKRVAAGLEKAPSRG